MTPNAEFNSEANVVPGEGDRLGDIMPSDEGVFMDSGRWPRIDRLIAHQERAAREAADEEYLEALMAEEAARHVGEAAVRRTSSLVSERTDHDVPQPLDPVLDAQQIETNKRGLTAVRAALGR